METTAIFTVLEHPLIKEWIDTCARRVFAPIEITVSHGRSAAHLRSVVAGDTVVLDQTLASPSSIREMRLTGARVVLLATPILTASLRTMLSHGIHALLTYGDPAIEMEAALLSASFGNFYISPSGARMLLTDRVDAQVPQVIEVGLTHREVAVLQAMAVGSTVRQTGRDLGISDKTVEAHRRRIFDKLRVGNHVEAVAVARRAGLLRAGRR